MRTSEFPLQTLKETPADAEVASHKLMLRAGMIRKLAAGLYTWLPLGLRVLRKVERIVREEMDRAGALEVLMPAVQPAELWQESGRWEQYGPELLRLKDRHRRDFCFGPTHEEIITELARNELRSYKQLPVNFYQIQTKFRDEIRPRFGVMRAREFLMKDAYSFHLDTASLDATYRVMFETYSRIFQRCGLEFRAVQADTGSIGGHASHEFHVLAESGEDAIAFSTESDYAANVELAEAVAPAGERPAPTKERREVDTPNQHSIEEVSKYLGVSQSKIVKTLIVQHSQGGLIALLLRGDHELNEIKASRNTDAASPLSFATDDLLPAAFSGQRIAPGAGHAGIPKTQVDVAWEQSLDNGREQYSKLAGSLGPFDLNIPITADHAVALMSDFVCGANTDGKHYTGVNWERDLPLPQVADLRNVQEGDPSPDGKGTLTIARGIEVGHIFQLGRKYSEAMKATVLDEGGKARTLEMGCYGIGVSRMVAAAIEQSHDERGIIWPEPLAPFQVALLPMKWSKSYRVREAAERLHEALSADGIEVLLDDRDVRAGFMFADMELIGIPHRILIGDKGLDEGKLEYKGRRDTETCFVAADEILPFLEERLQR